MDQDITKLPRIYTPSALAEGEGFPLSGGQAHYFRSVLRRQAGDCLRVFNGRDGEFLASIEELGKKSGQAVVIRKIREQPVSDRDVHLVFSPIKKQRMDILIEKAVELGVTAFHPVVTRNTQVRNINEDRVLAQITEAAEQCERMSLPVLNELVPLEKKLSVWSGPSPLVWCYERSDHPPLREAIDGHAAFLIGPEGGFTEKEASVLSGLDILRTISLGKTVYRVETAALVCLSYARATGEI